MIESHSRTSFSELSGIQFLRAGKLHKWLRSVDVFDTLLISFPMLLILKRLMHYIENGDSINEAFVKTRMYADNHEDLCNDRLFRSAASERQS